MKERLCLAAAPQVVIVGRLPLCDRNEPKSIGIRDFHLNPARSASIHDLKQFAELVVNAAGVDKR